ncbi:Spy/CpxP family protein refolding chaperone [Algoriphagus persicinus]|uniref:Spy/CpxP family protein refolding chaperone n=1 Tax=Algoriphagus persicinus TaxID=3108754 RepID=UPI002B3F2530|nr:TonB-dependent receptor plug domain-containing protein [Algoriphagus sp. E1-3-M2]MEB2786060.1 TonB-dependent receptor plug domain-containing protein [Algoriphagus sp. E1-3-M2]
MKLLLFLCLTLLISFANAQDLFQKNLYSADRVMELRKELELTDAQATKIKRIHSENAGKFSTMKWDLDDATAKLKELLDGSRIDEVAVQKQMDKVLALENSLKKQQLSTMVSIKNELSFEQQEILQTPRVQTVNGVSITGYGSSSFKTDPFYLKNYRVGKPGVATIGTSSSPKVAIRVAGTSNSENSPLYYTSNKDGMKQLKDISAINPEDIESIEVLKDKSAVDLFGDKGKNGVIIIKLKENPKN